MPFIVIFIFGAVVIGAGAMLAPAWSTREPRIGLNAALALGLVIGGALFWAYLFGWDTLVVDYLLFALVTSIFLFGTLSYGQKRAEERGTELLDVDQGWPGPRDLLFFLVVALLAILPALVLPVPLDTDAQGFGYLALTARLGGGFDTLAPFHPEISYLYSPGFTALIAYLSQQLEQPAHTVQLGVSAVLVVVLVLLAYDFGAEWRDKRLGRAMALCMLIGTGTLTAYMDSHYTTLLGLCFGFAFLIYMLRFIRDRGLPDAVAAGLMLGALAISHPDTTIIIGLGFAPFIVTMWLGKPRPTIRVWLVLLISVPLIGVLAISPWLAGIRDLLGSDIASPFERNPNYWQVMILYHGIIIVPLAILGAVIGLRRRDLPAILSVGWLILALDFSTTGIAEALLGNLLEPVLRYDYPFSIAWHAPIIPYSILGGIALVWLWDRFARERFGVVLHRFAPVGLAIAGAAIVFAMIFPQQVLALSKGRVGFYGAFSSAADVRAMDWLRENTPADARVLNHPGPHEADWVPVIAERDTIFYRPQPFFSGTEASEAEQAQFLAFWNDPADPAHEALLREAGVEYVIVPQVVTCPECIETMWRWRAPFTEQTVMQSSVSDAAYLELVFDEDGAQVYQLRLSETSVPADA